MNDDKSSLWDSALLLPGETSLRVSIIRELSEYLSLGAGQIEQKCAKAVRQSADEWKRQSPVTEKETAEFYDTYIGYIFEEASLGSLYRRMESCFLVLEWIREHGGKTLLDYGAGIGTMGLFFERQGLEVTLSDVSTPMQEFARWRFEKRGRSARFIDLKKEIIPPEKFDFIVAFDVFEHLVEPLRHLRTLSKALRPSGMLFIEAPFGTDPDRPMHIVKDSRVIDLGALMDLKGVNFSPFALVTAPRLAIFRKGYRPAPLRTAAICAGLIRYGLKRLKNGPALVFAPTDLLRK